MGGSGQNLACTVLTLTEGYGLKVRSRPVDEKRQNPITMRTFFEGLNEWSARSLLPPVKVQMQFQFSIMKGWIANLAETSSANRGLSFKKLNSKLN